MAANTPYLRYRMKGNNKVSPYEVVVWTCFNTPDFTGVFSPVGAGNVENTVIDDILNLNPNPSGYVVPTSSAGGDLTGFYPSPTVVGIDGIPINQSIAPTNGQALLYNGFDGYVEWTSVPYNSNFQPVFNVKTYGAVGDNTHDDTVAINLAVAAAVASAGSLGGPVVYFPGGTYKITSQLTIPCNINLKGDSYLNSILYFHGAINGVYWNSPIITEQAAASCKDLAVNSAGGGLTGMNVHNTGCSLVERCLFSGWSQQGILWLDTILGHMKNCLISACGSTVGDGYAAVEVDHAADGAGSTTWYWDNNNVTNNTNAVAGLRIDRTSVARVIGGTCEGSGIPIQISHKADATDGTTNVVIDGLDLEMNGTVADETRCFVELGYGMSAPTGFNQVFLPKVLNCTMFADIYNDGYGIKCKYTHGIYIDGNIILAGGTLGVGPHTIADIWFEGTTNDNISIGRNTADANTPYVVVNGITTAAVNYQPWFSTGFAINQTSYSDTAIACGTVTGTNGGDLVLTPQFGTPASGNVQGGNVVVNVQTPQGLGNVKGLVVNTDGYSVVGIGAPPGSPNAGSIGLGTDALNRGNYALSSLGSGNPLYVGIGSSLIEPQTGLSMGGYPLSVGGVFNVTAPMSAPAAPSSGFTIYIDSADGKLKAKSAGGTVTILALP